MPAVIYLFTAWMVSATMVRPQPSDLGDALELTAHAFSRNPSLTLWVGGISVALVLFTDTHSRVYKWLGGLVPDTPLHPTLIEPPIVVPGQG